MISREDLVEQSVTDYARAAIFDDRGYPADQVEMVEDFPHNMTELTKNIIALGFNFDDQGTQAELGSDLKNRTYVIEFFVFGLTGTYAKNLANVLKFALDRDGIIPLKDIEQPDAPVIDSLVVEGASTQRQVIADPEPWQEFVWTTTVRVTDTYHALMV